MQLKFSFRWFSSLQCTVIRKVNKLVVMLSMTVADVAASEMRSMKLVTSVSRAWRAWIWPLQLEEMDGAGPQAVWQVDRKIAN